MKDVFGILLIGKAGVGKSTVAKLLQKDLCGRACIIPMSSSLKQIAKEHFGWNGVKDERGRRLLQILGTEAGRAYNPDIWVNKTLERFYQVHTNLALNILIVDDIRFKNEIDILKKEIEKVWVIKLIGPQRIKLSDEATNHSSEHELDNYNDFSYIIDNSYSLEELEYECRVYLANSILRDFRDYTMYAV